MKALIIEDDKGIIDAVSAAFEFRWPGTVLLEAQIGRKGISMARSESPEVIILDLNLPDISGFDVLKEIREFSTTPIIILTVRSEDEDIMRGLEIGADDYIVKPFNYLTLLARVKAVLRRTEMIPFKGNQDSIVSARLKIDFVNQRVKVNNRPVKLTPVEYRLLILLAKNKNQVVPYRTITEELWGKSYTGSTCSIRSYISRLRKKLQDIPPQMIINKQGSGYILRS
ncbi:MAG: response regulator transcription factor [Dehalococcoidia bacterium]|nr:response regulator transcription factor [Dehalococcoidia bacterium]